MSERQLKKQDKGKDFALTGADERNGLAVCHPVWRGAELGDWESERSLTSAYLRQ